MTNHKTSKVNHTKKCQEILWSVTLTASAQHSEINCGKLPVFSNSIGPDLVLPEAAGLGEGLNILVPQHWLPVLASHLTSLRQLGTRYKVMKNAQLFIYI